MLKKDVRSRNLYENKQISGNMAGEKSDIYGLDSDVPYKRIRILQKPPCPGIRKAMACTGKWLRSVVQGYFNHSAVPGNLDSLLTFRARLTRPWRTQLRQRGQRHLLNWDRLHRLAVRWLPVPRVLHPRPLLRFAASMRVKSRMR